MAVFAALAAGVASAQQPGALRTVATLVDVQGNVLVSQADGMATATNGQRLAAGARVLTTASARATVIYDKGCVVHLEVDQRYMVRERAECTRAQAPSMGKAAEFAVLGGTFVSNTGATVVPASVGVSPGTRVAGFPPGRIEGTVQSATPAAEQAQKDAIKAYDALVGQECSTSLAGQDLGGLVLTPGVYCFPQAPARLTGKLTLDAQGDPNAVFVFQVGTRLTTAPKSVVAVKDDGRSDSQSGDGRGMLCNVFWQVNDSVSLGEGTRFIGNILASGAIDAGDEAEIVGRALAQNGAVSFHTVRMASCLLPLAFLNPATVTAIGVTAAGVGVIEEIRKPKSPN